MPADPMTAGERRSVAERNATARSIETTKDKNLVEAQASGTETKIQRRHQRVDFQPCPNKVTSSYTYEVLALGTRSRLGPWIGFASISVLVGKDLMPRDHILYGYQLRPSRLAEGRNVPDTTPRG
jgi:hypothetical protein